MEKFNFKPEAICADGGYDSREIYYEMTKLNIKAYIPRGKKPVSNANYTEDFALGKFIYEEENDQYICPADKILRYRNYIRRNGYKRYSAKLCDCKECPYRQQCVGNPKNPRKIERHLHEAANQKQMKFHRTQEYYEAMQLRAIWCEGNFAEIPKSEERSRADTLPPDFEPYKPKCRKSGTGCVTMINDHLYEGRYSPRNTYGKRESHNIYAKTREECEEKLAAMIVKVKVDIKAEKERLKTVNESLNLEIR